MYILLLKGSQDKGRTERKRGDQKQNNTDNYK